MPNMTSDLFQEALGLLRQAVGPEAQFRPDQWEAIRAIVQERRRLLLVQRTGWGKSAVYFIATRLLRDRGSGPTVIVSPLIALMRNQVQMADHLGLNSQTVNSTNREGWDPIFEAIRAGAVDLLLISPERLNNPQFRSDVLPDLLRNMGLLVVDEVHCISDWGHDFRPDYRRLSRIVGSLPPNLPVVGTTATANDRVVEDMAEQLGSDLVELRGPLERESLVLQVVRLPDRAQRMAWLAATIPGLAGSGIVYCLTIRDTERVGSWLRQQGIDASTYTGQSDGDYRLEVEERLSAGRLKVVVATSALGMGYDNPHIHFVIHFQSPGSPIAYYQQVGRAG
jgi:ATP-dependent DNA helicase RecQ